MRCCSMNCPRYYECGNSLASPSSNSDWEAVEPLLYWGSASYSMDKDGNVIIKEDYVCGPSGNWGRYYPRSDVK